VILTSLGEAMLGVTMPEITCPSCGIAVRADTVYCPFCRALVSRPNFRRLMLWTAVVAEYLSLAVLSVRR
jgi:hypothetical protein